MQNAPDPHALLAQVEESEHLITNLRQRTTLLNAEIRKRDERIAELEALVVKQDEDERTAS